MVNETEPIGTRRMIVGLIFGSLVGLVCYVSLEVSSAFLTQLIVHRFSEFDWRDLQIYETILFFLLFGAPIAVFSGLLVGFPVWRMAEDRILRSNRSALIYGSLTGGCIGLMFLVLELAIGLNTFLDDRSSYDSWSYGYQLTRDGMPTALGWLAELKTLVFFFAAGAVGGFVARTVAIRR
jgi:hypothetical protein